MIKIDPSEWTDKKYILWVKNANQRKKKLWDTKNTEQTQWKKFQEETEEEIRRNVITDQSVEKSIDKQLEHNQTNYNPYKKSKWEEEYKPKEEISEITLKRIIQEITEEELEEIINNTARNKAPGPTHLKRNNKKKFTTLRLDFESRDSTTETQGMGGKSRFCKTNNSNGNSKENIDKNNHNTNRKGNRRNKRNLTKQLSRPTRRLYTIPNNNAKQPNRRCARKKQGNLTTIPRHQESLRFSRPTFSAAVITEYGLTDPYHIERGVKQGDTISSLLWIHNRRENNKRPKKSTKRRKNSRNSSSNGIYRQYSINSKKQRRNDKNNTNRKEKPKPNGGNPIRKPNHQLQQKQRYLGVWVQVDGKKIHQQKLMGKKINYTLAIIRKTRTTDKQCRYIINHILIPQLEYLATDHIPPESWLNKQDRKIRTAFKHKCNLAKNLTKELTINLYTEEQQKSESNRYNSAREIGKKYNITIKNQYKTEIPKVPIGGVVTIEQIINDSKYYLTKGKYPGKELYWYKIFEEKLMEVEFEFAQQYNYVNTFNPLEKHYTQINNDNNNFKSPLHPCENCNLLTELTSTENNTNKGKTKADNNHLIRIKTDEHPTYHLNLRQIRMKPNERMNTNNKGLIPKLNQSPESLLNFCKQKTITDQIISQQNTKMTNQTKLIEYLSRQTQEITNIKNIIIQRKIISLEAFTNGSIVIKPNQENDEEILTLNGKIEGPPSSTRAELAAIAILLDIILNQVNRVKINTDSEAAIAAISNFIEPRKRKK
ncbi:hypothetical protein Glove_557g33 [Diversispora epigaea]|uniref:Uncharacterized protein n=1 Tax=Diversispora epigaea TaxID=1348612 RepID=A0A397GAU3_9GLOM|nr:hypothetical protein Glove_557g33 [Diversispora epigaea]